MNYTPRVIDAVVEHALAIAGAVLLEGVRACGKTATGLHHSNSAVRLDVDDQARAMAALEPALVLDGESPRLIDEWQLEPRLWNHVRRAVDDTTRRGRFLLAGSATPDDDVTRHSGAGRILRVRMRPMSLSESGHSNAKVSLSAVLSGTTIASATSGLGVRDIAERICVGGWPGLQAQPPDSAQQILRSYLDDVARADVQLVESSTRKRDPVRLRRLMTSYSRHVATSASLETIARDTAEPGSRELNTDTARQYVDLLKRVMVVEEQPSWAPHLRSRDTVRKAAVRHFVDPSLAVAALGASVERLMRDPRTLGLLFESLVVRDLRVYAQALDGDVLHYRDSAGVEADAIVQLRDGRWAMVEVKLGESRVDEAATSLTALAGKVDTSKGGPPVARIIVTGGQYAYTRPDGVIVVPLGCLGP
jgi:hypothetical protein